jgi:hypothetical protein
MRAWTKATTRTCSRSLAPRISSESDSLAINRI